MSDLLLFRVNRSRREVSGLVLPFGARSRPESTTGHQFRFDGPGTIDVPESVPLYHWHDEDHPDRHPIGHSSSLETRADGVYGVFPVEESPEGDRVLDDIESGKLRGFSAEVGKGTADCYCTARTKRCACDVESSTLVAVALVDSPAFMEAWFSSSDTAPTAATITTFFSSDGARVASVHASRKGAQDMSDTNGNGNGEGGGQPDSKPTVLDKPDAGLKRFEQEINARFATVADKLAESQEAQTEAIGKVVGDAFAAAFTRLEDVDAGGRGEAAAARVKVISEPPVYRFSGGHGHSSLVKDAWTYHIDRDMDARDRLRKFQQQQADLVKFATVTTGNASEVIPPGYRPDLYVTQLMQGRPIVSQASRGTISDATPFTVPRFVSATGATADHVQGVNPADGTIDLDTVTVTPGAISGVFKLTREIIDAANPAIDAIAMAAMRESWNRQTEQKAYAELNVNANVGVSSNVSLALLDTDAELLVDQTITPARDLLARYPFTRFASPTGAVIGQLVTRNFANAKDTTGRPLLPSIGAQNTAGVGNAVQQGWFVDGLPFVPAWAITQAVGDELALILNRQDWWVWESPLLTFRFEEKSGPAMVELALFGYYAVKVLRPAGIFSLRAVA